MQKADPKFRVEYEKRPDEAFDRMVLKLPLPRWMRLPEETRRHLRAARREQLLALRSLVTAAIDRLEKSEPAPTHQPGAGAE